MKRSRKNSSETRPAIPRKELFPWILDNISDVVTVLSAEGVTAYISPSVRRTLGYEPEELIGQSAFALVHPEDVPGLWTAFVSGAQEPGAVRRAEYRYKHKDGSWRILESVGINFLDRAGAIIISSRDITERHRAEAQLRDHLATQQALYAGAERLTKTLHLSGLTAEIARTCVRVFGVSLAWIGMVEPDGNVRVQAQFPKENNYPRTINVRWDDALSGLGPTGRAVRGATPVIIDDLQQEPQTAPWAAAAKAGYVTLAALPLVARDKVFGILNLCSDQAGFFSPDRVEFLRAYANGAAAALENARLFEETERRLHHLGALRAIDLAITGSLDLRLTLNVILEQVMLRLQVDAADFLLLNPHSQLLDPISSRGFRAAARQETLRLGEGTAGRAALERKRIQLADLAAATDLKRKWLVSDERFVAYFGVPLIAKGRVLGVLEIFHRAPLTPDTEWMEFLDALATQAAIAIESAAMFDDLQRSHAELALAYESTLEGWSQALDLRDRETEGHTQRVTEMTVRLARAMGMPDADIAQARRGALLHDIGKMGIPDSILLKPGPLTDDEWVLMRRHPEYAYQLLSSIEYLRPALDIPRFHHERWDGSGYPQGLRGEQIPLAARIFAVADVWDALRSDRPYRAGWPEGKTRDYIREQSGVQFDPQVVLAFLALTAPTGRSKL